MPLKPGAHPALTASIATAVAVVLLTAVPALGGPNALTSAASPLKIAKNALKVAKAADKRSRTALAQAKVPGPAGPAGVAGPVGATGPAGAAGAPGPTASASATLTTEFANEVPLTNAETAVITQRITTTFSSRLIATGALAMRERATGTSVLAACRLQIAPAGGTFEDMSTGTQGVSFSGAAQDFKQVVVHGAKLRAAGAYDVRVACIGSATGDVGVRFGDLTILAAAT
jgi:hypothetical protein